MRVCGKPGCAECPRILAIMGSLIMAFALIAVLSVVI